MGIIVTNPQRPSPFGNPKLIGFASLVMSGMAFFTTPMMGILAAITGIFGAYRASTQTYASEFTFLNILGAIVGFTTFLLTRLFV